jgi:hypothetical protein
MTKPAGLPKPRRRQALGKMAFNSGELFSRLGQLGETNPVSAKPTEPHLRATKITARELGY